ncbi:MAG: hypothetical protein AABX71_00465 [Nanoarchaeota archaeon]
MEKREAGIIVSVFILALLALFLISGSSFSELKNKITGRAVGSPYKSCEDSDGGKNQWEKGAVTYSYKNRTSKYYADYCYTNKRLKEYFCTNLKMTDSKKFVCEFGCVDGACISKQACADSDEGEDYFERGALTGTNQSGDAFELKDYCMNEKSLVEYSCENSSIASREYSCPQDCSLGACIAG